MIQKITGLNTAVITPMYKNGDVNFDEIDKYAEYLIGKGLNGVFVCGSTGEGLLLTVEERKAILEKWMKYSDRLNILVHVGHTSYKASQALAEHAGKLGVRAISSMGPCFLQPNRVEELVAFNKEFASCAPETPYYYYHIPTRSGVTVSMEQFLTFGKKEIPNLCGLKYTSQNTFEELKCIKLDNGSFDILHGHDETFVLGLQMGAQSGIGTSLNVSAKLFKDLKEAFDAGDMGKAMEIQCKANEIIALMCRHNAIVGIKALLEVVGINAGPCRLPLRNIGEAGKRQLAEDFSKYLPIL